MKLWSRSAKAAPEPVKADIVPIMPAAIHKAPAGLSANVCVLMGSLREAEIAKRAMSVGERPGARSSVAINADGESLVIDFTAEDFGALRATMNSVLREAKIASDSMLFDSKKSGPKEAKADGFQKSKAKKSK